jgi:hypothetical protein
MKICVQCHDEYRDDINTCMSCGVDLVSHVAGMQLDKVASQGGQVDLEKAVKVMEGTLAACKEIEGMLKRQKFPCLLVPVTVGNVTNYALCINSDRVEDYTAIMKLHFSNMVRREHSKEWEAQDVHLDGGDVTCPACGHVGQLQDGQCGDCGLMLGVSEPT